MYYFVPVLVPANTTQALPIKQLIKLDLGIIDYIEVEFPAGCAGLVHLVIYDKGWIIVPFNQDASLYGNDRIFHMTLDYQMTEEPYTLQIFAWNSDDTYDHTVSIGVQLSIIPDKTVLQTLLEGA